MKPRLLYLGCTFFTVILGLASRADGIALPEFLELYAGDTLWALMVFWLIRFVKPSLHLLVSAGLALGFSFLIEFSQLIKFAWLDAIRNTTLGGLVLGFGFKWSDLACYSVGVSIGVLTSVALFVPNCESSRSSSF